MNMKKKNKKLYNFTEKQRRRDRTRGIRHFTSAPKSFTQTLNRKERAKNKAILIHNMQFIEDAFFDEKVYYPNKRTGAWDYW